MLEPTRSASEVPTQDITQEPDWTEDARYFEYTRAADPIRLGHAPAIPLRHFGASLYSAPRTQVVPLDISDVLQITGPATSPALCANFVRILAGESIATNVNATSELYYVLRGQGFTETQGGVLHWEAGDFFTLPGPASVHHADTDSVLYYVHDAPLLAYLGVQAAAPRFRPTLYPHERCNVELEKARRNPAAPRASRISVLLANSSNVQTLTATPTLWAMVGLLPQGDVQRAHRHQSVALDLVVACQPGCYTLVGEQINALGTLVNPERVDWEPGAAFITPPGMWHAHHNESAADAYIIPIQDAGLQTYLRSLDIRFGPHDRPAVG